jgi:hypothetical protein
VGSAGTALPDLQLRHLTGACRRCFYVNGGRSQTFISSTSWILDGDRWWPLSGLPTAPPRARHRCLQFWWWPLSNLAASTPRGPRHRHFQLRWWPLPDLAASIPRGPTFDVFNFGGGRCRILPLAPPRGPAIDVFNFGGGRCRTLPPAPPGGPPSTSSTSVVAAAGPCRQHPQGVCHRRLQLRWWPLPDLAASTPRGSAINIFNFGGGRY